MVPLMSRAHERREEEQLSSALIYIRQREEERAISGKPERENVHRRSSFTLLETFIIIIICIYAWCILLVCMQCANVWIEVKMCVYGVV